MNISQSRKVFKKPPKNSFTTILYFKFLITYHMHEYLKKEIKKEEKKTISVAGCADFLFSVSMVVRKQQTVYLFICISVAKKINK